MKKFKFRLQTLLTIREVREREIQYELAKIVSLQNREREKQADLRRRIEEQKDLFGDKLKQGKPIRRARRSCSSGSLTCRSAPSTPQKSVSGAWSPRYRRSGTA